MRDMKGFFPNLFLGWLGPGGGRPAWLVMLLAAMASGALYTVAWAVLVLLARGGALFAEEGVFSQVLLSERDCGGNPGPNPSYATSPKSLRYCMGLL